MRKVFCDKCGKEILNKDPLFSGEIGATMDWTGRPLECFSTGTFYLCKDCLKECCEFMLKWKGVERRNASNKV